MPGILRLQDFRCFRRESPVELVIRPGFSAVVGPNNSGKSALLRAPYELRSALGYLAVGGDQYATTGLLKADTPFNLPSGLLEPAELVADRPQAQLLVEVWPDKDENLSEEEMLGARLTFSQEGRQFRISLLTADRGVVGESDGLALNGARDDLLVLRNGSRHSLAPLRRFATELSELAFFGPFRNAINEGAGSHFDTPIGSSFVATWHQWKTGTIRSQNLAIQRVTGDIKRLIGADTLEINAANEYKTLQVIVNGRPLKLHEMGSGIAQLIVVLGNALTRSPSYVAIDEPEIHLHPGLQADFLTTLASYTKYGGVLFSTHSVGLARAVADRCQSVTSTSQGTVVRPFERTTHYAEFLGSMGIASLQEFGWDQILLVEGVKDVRTVQQWLRLFSLDRRTVVLPLGGDALVNGAAQAEFSEIVRLGGHISALVDSERESEESQPIKARSDFKAVCASFRIECHLTEKRAIENYLPQEALNEAFGLGRYSALGPFERLGATGTSWGKGQSWLAARHMTVSDLDATDLGVFFRSLLEASRAR